MAEADQISPKLTTMPWFIKKEIVAATDFRTKCCLRKVSKEFRQFAHNSPHQFESITIDPVNNGSILITVEDAFGECQMDYSAVEDHVPKAALDFCLMLKHPDTTVETFTYSKETDENTREAYELWKDLDYEFLSAVNWEMNQFTHKLNVTRVELGNYLDRGTLVCWIPIFKPSTLKVIDIHINGDTGLHRVTESVQWREATALIVQNARDIEQVDMANAHFLITTGSHLRRRQIVSWIRKLLQPADHFRAVEMISAVFNVDEFQRAILAFDLIHARNGVFIKLPDSPGFLRISQSNDEIRLNALTEEEHEEWPLRNEEDAAVEEEDVENGAADDAENEEEQPEEPENDDE